MLHCMLYCRLSGPCQMALNYTWMLLFVCKLYVDVLCICMLLTVTVYILLFSHYVFSYCSLPLGSDVTLQLMALPHSFWVSTGSLGSRCNLVQRTRVCSCRGSCSPSIGGRTQRPCCSITWPSTACPCGKACLLLVRAASPASRNTHSPRQASDWRCELFPVHFHANNILMY